MKLPKHETLLVRQEKANLFITLNRPELRNAMNLKMVQELMQVCGSITESREIRAVVLRGASGHFCAGGDVKDMVAAKEKSADSTGDPFYEMNREFGKMLTLINSAPQVVITVLEGAVLGGGFGLACVSDIAIAKKDAHFGLPETGLGIPPAQIIPFVVQRIGLMQARRLGVLGARFNGEQAKQLAVVHTVCATNEEIEQELKTTLAQIKRCAPGANAVTKKLILAVGSVALDKLLDQAARDFSSCLQGPEGREGTTAFKQKRLPYWAKK